MQLLLFIPVLFFSIILHEFAHGFVAYRMGDQTAYYSGRLTLNPLAHIDMIGTIAVPLLCLLVGMPLFGWAKPVPINPLKLPSPRRDMGKVALAGPAVNLALALGFAIVFKLVLLLAGELPTHILQSLFTFFQYGILVNVMLAVFNLIPITPLDGGRIVTALLPLNAALEYDRFLGRFGMWIVFGLIATGLIKYLILPPAYLVLTVISSLLQI